MADRLAIARVLATILLSLLFSVSSAQAELFAIVRDGAFDEVVDAIAGQQGLTRLVDEYEQDLLMYAAAGNHDPRIVRHLVAMGFDVNRSTSTRWTPLMFAVRMNPEPLVAQTLIELGANIGLVNLAGQRAIDLVSANPNPGYRTHPVVGLLTLAAALTPTSTQSTTQQQSLPPPPPPPAQTSCCRVCRTGKACGNSCISRSNTCHRGQGCACQGVLPDNPLIVAEVRAMLLLDSGDIALGTCDFTNIAFGGRVGATLL